MGLYIIIGLLLVTSTAAVMSGLNPFSTSDKLSASPEPVKSPCYDYDVKDKIAPITFKDVTYNLIKKSARVSGPNPQPGEEDKFNLAMTDDLGAASDGKQVRKLDQPNFFGEPLENFENIIYTYSPADQRDGATFFSVYMKDGEDMGLEKYRFIKECKTLGGSTVLSGINANPNNFPPTMIFKSDIEDKKAGIAYDRLANAYGYLNRKVDKATFDSYDESSRKEIGSVQTNKGSMKLYDHLGIVYLKEGDSDYHMYNGIIALPGASAVPNSAPGFEKALQIQSLPAVETPQYTWFTPECKPAIYLYPEKNQQIQVKVFPKGKFTYTDPIYPEGGWIVQASPDGRLEYQGKEYPYLYYESAIENKYISKPEKGYYVEYQNLSFLFDELLYKMGLNGKEIYDFKEYWLKALKYSPYYFVGVMNNQEIEKIEPWEITPMPDSTIRVRLYFEPSLTKLDIEKPILPGYKRSGFSVVEWGGLVRDPENKFVCSQ